MPEYENERVFQVKRMEHTILMGRNHRQENLERLGNWSIENKINN
jgi:hypothetical protein